MGAHSHTRSVITPIVLGLAVTLLAGAGLLVRSDAGPQHRHQPSASSGLAVHEWGTFTVMQGSDGVALEGMQHEQEHLPAFVASMTGSTPSVFRPVGVTSRDVPVRRVRNKMETPVLYFHTNKRQRVKVRVDFRKGIINQYYPEPIRQVPGKTSRTLDVSKLRESYAEWDVELFPRGRGLSIPKVARGNIYGFAREAKSAYLRARTATGTQDEQFIFYRGLGRAVPKVEVKTRRNGYARIYNQSRQAIPDAFALHIDGERGRFVRIGRIGAGARTTVRLRGRFLSKARVVARLGKQVQRTLVAQGLHADEARAMVRTWSKSWFTSQGTRILYVVPAGFVDSVLPIRITPKPDKLVRVFVGRIELMTPEEEGKVERTLESMYGKQLDWRSAALRELAHLGRFIEPKVRRVIAKTGNRSVRLAGLQVLRAFARARQQATAAPSRRGSSAGTASRSGSRL
jgi:hypothetical protein